MEELRGQIGTYRLVDHVARGRSGDTYRAEAIDGAPVAIKIHDRADDGQGEIDRLARVDHPAVVALLDHGRTPDGRVWLALEWIDGPSLTDVLATSSPLTVADTRRLLGPLASAVDALHRSGIVHGDLSPNNVIVGVSGRPTLLD
ncbi:MAG: protein kinase, partial [Actinomycetota bacterium]